MVTITNSGFTAGQITETLPDGFSFDANADDAVSPDDVRARTQGQDVIFTLRGTGQFSYKVMASNVLGEHRFPFSNGVRYLDDGDDPQNGGPVTGADTVTVRMMPTVDPTSTPVPEPTRRTPRRRGGGGGGGGGGYAPPVVTATPMPTRAPEYARADDSADADADADNRADGCADDGLNRPNDGLSRQRSLSRRQCRRRPYRRRGRRQEWWSGADGCCADEAAGTDIAKPKPTAEWWLLDNCPPTAAPPTEVPATAMVEPTEPPAPTATTAPTVAPVTPVAPDEDGMPTWLIILIIVIIVGVVIAAVGFYMMRMRR